ncbi:MAG: GFA family protein [Rhizobiales bacterium]|nr:GFA family protein [Hyphomicrobiales bacterium]
MAQHRAACQCGALTVTAAADPEFVVLCNCKACQQRTGAPFGVGAYFAKDAVTVAGAVNTWTRSSDSGRALTNHFCAACGSNLYWTLEMRPGHMGVAVGAFDQPLPEPQRAIWAQEKLDWVTFPDHWPVYDTGSPPE